MLIESKIKIGPDSMLDIHQANIKSAHLLNKIVLVQFQRNRTVSGNPNKRQLGSKRQNSNDQFM